MINKFHRPRRHKPGPSCSASVCVAMPRWAVCLNVSVVIWQTLSTHWMAVLRPDPHPHGKNLLLLLKQTGRQTERHVLGTSRPPPTDREDVISFQPVRDASESSQT